VTLPAIFAVLIGVGMIGQWTVSYLSRQIPELKTEPYRMWFHMAGDLEHAHHSEQSGKVTVRRMDQEKETV
jgi:hypothetical protein